VQQYKVPLQLKYCLVNN